MRTLPPAADAVPTAPRTVGFADLARHGARTAIITNDEEISYLDLAARVEAVAARLGSTRRLVLIAGANRLDPLIAYLAALAGGHVPLLVPPAQVDAVAAAYEPDVVMGTSELTFRGEGTAHELHPDLALLMCTSGSTGSPKLVRLSHRNLEANAESIAAYLAIRPEDRALTTLPMHYCYGLSVIHSHLLRGAAIILTELSVADPCFWELLRRHRGTTFAGVPLTFELLDRVGFADMRLPSLRYVTQAGGRLASERVRRYAELGRRRGWDLFVMYGQTEATARMAYLPPDLAVSHAHAIGVPIPGGTLTLDPIDRDGDPNVGELVYSGPNVMLGYADNPADLGLGRTVTELRTGDLARLNDSGVYEIVGRLSRFVKISGLRIDLQHLEETLAADGLAALCAGDDHGLVVAIRRGPSAQAVRRRVARECGLPAHAIQVYPVDDLPRLPTGKPDYQGVLNLRRRTRRRGGDSTDLRALFAEVLDRPDATEDSTFVGLGGDSLSYVEMSTRLEEALGHVPPDWHVTPIRDLRPRVRRIRSMETSVLLRALAIIFIVGTHAGLWGIQGGAHLLLGVAGFNFGRFQAGPEGEGRGARLRRRLTSIAWIAVPSMVWIAAVHVVTGQYGLANIFLLNGFLGPETWSRTWHFWFVEILVYITLGVTAVLALPWLDRLSRRFPFGLAVTVLGAGLLTRFEVVEPPAPHMMPALWIFALGWAAAKASSHWQRLVLTVVAVAAVPGFFGDPARDGVILAGLLVLMWTATLPCPAPLNRVAGILASASLYIYLTHWQVYPLIAEPAAALPVSIGAGIVAWLLVTRSVRLARGALRRVPLKSR